jgi:hypothetical protein
LEDSNQRRQRKQWGKAVTFSVFQNSQTLPTHTPIF